MTAADRAKAAEVTDEHRAQAAEIMRSRAFHIGGVHVLAAALAERDAAARADAVVRYDRRVQALAEELEAEGRKFRDGILVAVDGSKLSVAARLRGLTASSEGDGQ